jgi:hypothetical protein
LQKAYQTKIFKDHAVSAKSMPHTQKKCQGNAPSMKEVIKKMYSTALNLSGAYCMHLKKNTCSQCPKCPQCPQCPLCLCTMSTMCTMCTMSTMFTMSTMSQIHHFYVGNGVRSNSGRSLFPDRQGTVFSYLLYLTFHY